MPPFESYALLTSFLTARLPPARQATQTLIPPETTVVTVADREADIYDLFVLPRRPNSELIVGAGLGTSASLLLINEQQNPPYSEITFQQNPPLVKTGDAG